MMRYKVGDRVKIREDLEVGRVYGGCVFTGGMQYLAGKVVRIIEVNGLSKQYRIDSYCCYWTDEMFENTEAQGMNKHVGLYINGNKVIAVNVQTGKEGIARCHPDDTFDFFVGAKIALERLEEAEKPYGWLKLGVRYYFPVPAVSDLYNAVTYVADDWDKRIMKRGIAFPTKEEAIACAKKMLAAVKQEG